MAASKKKKPASGRGSSPAKGQNSRTGGQATPRAPKPKDESAEPAPSTTAKRKWGSRGSGPSPTARETPTPAPRASKASRSRRSSSGEQPLQPRAGKSSSGSGNGSRPASGTAGADQVDDVDDRQGDREGDSYADDYTDEDPHEFTDEDKAGGAAGVSLADKARLWFAGLSNPPDADERPARERAPARTREPVVDEYLSDGTKVPRWGLGDVAIAFFAAIFVPIIGLFILLGLGYVPTAHAPDLGGDGAALGQAVGHLSIGQPPSVIRSTEYAPVLLQFLTGQVLFWIGLMVPTAWAVWKKGNGFVKDLKLRFAWIDVPIGLAVGVACQLLLIPGIYWIVKKLGVTEDVGAVARDVVDQAVDPLSTAIVVITTTIGAPIVEEIYYRGLTLRAAEKRFGPGWALAGTSAFFAVTHFKPIVWPGILVFGVILGVLAQRTNRLGTSICAHVAFNLTTLTILLLHLDLPV